MAAIAVAGGLNTCSRIDLIASRDLWPFIACPQDLSSVTRPVMISDWGLLVPAIDMRACRLPSQLSPGTPSPEYQP
jgi:hypothetical protein